MDYWFGALISIMVVSLIIFIIVYIISSIGKYLLFKKSGRPGWHAFIPILNTYQICNIAHTRDFFVWMIVVTIGSPIVNSIVSAIFKGDFISSIISLIIYIIQIWMTLIVYKRLAESFGYGGWGWVILMLLLSPIIFIIMGVNDSIYVEPKDELTLKDYIQYIKNKRSNI